MDEGNNFSSILSNPHTSGEEEFCASSGEEAFANTSTMNCVPFKSENENNIVVEEQQQTQMNDEEVVTPSEETLLDQSDKEYSVTITSITSTGTQMTIAPSLEGGSDEEDTDFHVRQKDDEKPIEMASIQLIRADEGERHPNQTLDHLDTESVKCFEMTPAPDKPGKVTFKIEPSQTATKSSYSSFPLGQTIKLILIGSILTCITNFPSAFMHSSANTAVEELNAYLNRSYINREIVLDSRDFSFIRSFMHSIWYAGQVLGAVITPYICDKYGRKPAYICATLWMTIACALQMASTLFPYPEILIFGRVLASIFSPMSDACAILYFQEISPVHLRGTLSSLFATGYAAMALIGMIFGIRNVFGHSLTLLFSIPIVPGLLSILFLIWIPETPKFLYFKKHNISAAMKSLCFYQGATVTNSTTDPMSVLASAEDEEGIKDERSGSILNIFVKSHLRKALTLSLAVMVPTMAFYPILQSSTYFLLSLGIDRHFASMASMTMMIVLTTCCIFAAVLLEKFQRRTLIIGFGITSQIALVLFVICASLLVTVKNMPSLGEDDSLGAVLPLVLQFGAVLGLVFYVISYGCGIGPISYFIAPELVPVQNRSSMFCICFGLCSGMIVVTNFLTLPLYEMIGPSTFLILFVLPSVLALIYLFLQLPETKNRETQLIVVELKYGRRKIANKTFTDPHTLELGGKPFS